MTDRFFRALAKEAAARYPARDRYARHFAYGKLTGDPVFAHLLRGGLVPGGAHLLDRHGARATFFCIGERAERHPELVREIVRRGHTVENHSRGHRVTFALMGLGGIRGEIESAQRTLAELTGRAPRFFRPPAGIHSPLLDPVLHAMGLELVSWTRRGFDTRRTDAAEVVALLTQDLAAGDILLLHDGHCARTVDGQPVAIEALANLLDAARKQGLRAVTLSQAIDS